MKKHDHRDVIKGQFRHIVYSAVSMFIGSWVVLTYSGCGNGVYISNTKLDSEEAGYNNEFWNVHRRISALAHDLKEAVSEAENLKLTGQKKEANKKLDSALSLMEKIRDESEQTLDRLVVVLPPQSLAESHKCLIHLLRKAERSENVIDVAAACVKYYAAIDSFNQSLEGRPDATTHGSQINLVYHPPGSPIGLNLANGEFAIEVSLNTPLGSFSASDASGSGIKRLVIRAQGKERIFSLDRPFTVFVPTSYGVNIVNKDRDELIVEVLRK